MADGRVEIKFLTDTKEIESAKKTVDDLGKTIDKALEVQPTSSATTTIEKVGTSAEVTADKMDELAKNTDQASQSVDKLGTETDQLGKGGVGRLPEEIEDVGNRASKATGGVGSLVKAIGLLKVAGVAISMIHDSVGDAVDRVDTMRQFPRMMQQVGFSAEETENSIERLSSGIDGLPTALDEVVSTAQQLALTTGDLGQATELTLALNNAFLASGSSSADASRGLQQFSQMLSSGKVDMQSWKTLLETMPLALQTVAANFGYTGASAKNDLYAALQDGTITFDDFSQALIDANEAQGGFAELAKTNSEGMATSWTNIKTAFVKGVADVITALDELIEGVTGKNIAKHFDTIKVIVGNVFSTISDSIRGAIPYLQAAVDLLNIFSSEVESIAEPSAVGDTLIDVGKLVEGWNDLTLEEKIAQVDTMGEDQLEELMIALGVDFEELPDEYHKDAYLNAYGKDSLEEILFLTGQWHNLTFEEKRVILEAQIDNVELSNAIESRELWNNEEFYSQLAEINMNDDNAEQQVLDLINYWAEIEGLEPVDVKVNSKPMETATDLVKRFPSDWNDAWARVKRAFHGTQNWMTQVGSSMQKLIFDNTKSENWEEVGQWVGTKIGEGIEGLTSRAETGLDVGAEMLTWIGEQIEAIEWDTLGESVGKGISEFIKKGVEFFTDGSEVQSSFRAKLNEVFIPALNEAFKQLDVAGLALLDGLFKGLTGGTSWETFEENWKTAWGAIKDIDIDWEADFVTLAGQIETAIGIGFEGFSWSDLLPELSWGSWQTQVDELVAAINGWVESIQTAWNRLKEDGITWEVGTGNETEEAEVPVWLQPKPEINPHDIPVPTGMEAITDQIIKDIEAELVDPAEVTLNIDIVPKFTGGASGGSGKMAPLTGSVGGGLSGTFSEFSGILTSLKSSVEVGMSEVVASADSGMS